MSSGEGEKSHIFKTTDGGETWTLQYTGNRKDIFLDSIACLSETRCFALSDPLDGKFLLLTTTDGQHWIPLASGNMPAALPGEGAFAASNTCLLLSGEEIFFGTSGIFSIARGDENEVVVVGGDYKNPKRASFVAAYSLDEGKTWQLSAQQPGGYRSSVACVDDALCVAVGPSGEDVSVSKVSAALWKPTDALNLNAVAILDILHGWAVGPNGTIARFVNNNLIGY